MLEGNRGTRISPQTLVSESSKEKVNQTFKFDGFDEQSFFPFRRRVLLALAIVSATSLILLFYLGSDINSSLLEQESVLRARTILFLIGPLLSFTFYMSLLMFLFYKETYRRTFKIIFEYAIIGGIVSILFALTLNVRAIILALVLAAEFEAKFSIFVFTAIIVPVIEETAKAVPVYYLSKGLLTRENSDKEYRLLQNMRTPVLVGSITGAIFNVLETYWYVWQLGYLFDLDNENSWQIVSSQIMIRSLNPLHLFTSAITGVGVGLTIWNSNRKILLNQDYKTGIQAFLLAVVIHGLWNGSLILADEDTNTLRLFGIELPIFNVFLLIVTLVGIISLWGYMSNFESVLCEYCEEWHKPPYTKEDHYNIPKISVPLTYKILNLIKPRKYKCASCASIVVGVSCSSCNSMKVFNCGNCYATIPAHASECWKCQKSVDVPFGNILAYPDNSASLLSKPLVYILAGFYIPSALTTLIILSNFFSVTDEDISAEIDRIMIIFLFLLFLGLALVQISRWLNDDYRYAMGYS
ncbi:MAG: PrsW family glutamic-type intramembrane protease, partial [Candidatus Heimdallarchaeota archaeon]